MSNKKDEVPAGDMPGRPPTQRSFLKRLVDAMQTMDEGPYDHLEHRIHALEAQMERLTRSIKKENEARPEVLNTFTKRAPCSEKPSR